MLERCTTSEFSRLTKYDRIVVYLFRRLTSGLTAASFPRELHFTSEDVRIAMSEAMRDGAIDGAQANPPDIKYTFDARRPFPSEVEQLGPVTWLSTRKGRYKLLQTRRKNLLVFPHPDYPNPAIELVSDQTPPFISSLLGRDEQATFTRVRNSGLITTALGFHVWPIQGHHRTTVSYGQIEIDEVHAGLDRNVGTIVPISGKGGADKLSWSQALNLNTYGIEKAPIAGLRVRSIGLWRDKEDTVWIVEFSPEIDIDKIEILGLRRFRIVTSSGVAI